MKTEDTLTITGTQLLDIYLDGFVSGVCSTLNTFSEMPQDVVIELSQRLTQGLLDSAEGKAMILNEIQERLTDSDTGPKHETVPLPLPSKLVGRAVTKPGQQN